jgi:hypothetical protein
MIRTFPYIDKEREPEISKKENSVTTCFAIGWGHHRSGLFALRVNRFFICLRTMQRYSDIPIFLES